MARSIRRRRGLIGSAAACGTALAATSLAFACSANMTTSTVSVTPDTAPAGSSPTVTVSGSGYATSSVQLDYLAAGAAGDCHKAGGVTPSTVTATQVGSTRVYNFINQSAVIANTGPMGVATFCAQDTNGTNGAHTPFVVS